MTKCFRQSWRVTHGLYMMESAEEKGGGREREKSICRQNAWVSLLSLTHFSEPLKSIPLIIIEIESETNESRASWHENIFRIDSTDDMSVTSRFLRSDLDAPMTGLPACQVD